MENLIKMSLSLVLSLLALTEGRTLFPGRHLATNLLQQQNTLSPIGANSDRGESMKDWVKITPNERTLRVREGQRLELECAAIGSPSPRLQWFKDQMPATQMMEEDNFIRGFGIAKIVRKFIVDCAVPELEGEYSCSAIAGGVSADSGSKVVVVDSLSHGDRRECKRQDPRIVLWAQIVMQTMDSEVKIPCKAHGGDVQWASRDGQIITNIPGSRFKVLDSGDLIISKLRWADMGTYTCFTENAHGKDSVSTFLYPMLSED